MLYLNNFRANATPTLAPPTQQEQRFFFSPQNGASYYLFVSVMARWPVHDQGCHSTPEMAHVQKEARNYKEHNRGNVYPKVSTIMGLY